MFRKLEKNFQSGFTMIEMLIVIALIAILAGFSAIYLSTILSKNNLDVTSQTVVSTLRRAQVLSQAVKEDSPWGVKINIGEIVLFKGDGYLNRDPNYDELTSIPNAVDVLGISEVVYSKMSGLPNTTGDITLQASATEEQKNININTKGRLTY